MKTEISFTPLHGTDEGEVKADPLCEFHLTPAKFETFGPHPVTKFRLCWKAFDGSSHSNSSGKITSLMLESLTLVWETQGASEGGQKMNLIDRIKSGRGSRSARTYGVIALSACVSFAVIPLVIATPVSAAKPGIGTSYYFSYSKTKKYTITLEKIVDPSKPSTYSMDPPPGTRFIGVEFKVVNTGKKAIDPSVATFTYAVDTSGGSLQYETANSKNCPAFDGGAGDAAPVPGSYIIGCVLFAVPKKQKLTKIEFGSGTPVIWKV